MTNQTIVFHFTYMKDYHSLKSIITFLVKNMIQNQKKNNPQQIIIKKE